MERERLQVVVQVSFVLSLPPAHAYVASEETLESSEMSL